MPTWLAISFERGMSVTQEIIQSEKGRAVSQSTAVTPMQMVQIALENGADIDQLQKLMEMQERWEANEARKAYVVALNAFKEDPPTIKKNKHVRFATQKGETEYDHATLDQCVGCIVPVLSRYGLSHNWSTTQADSQIAVTCRLTHVLGHSESVTMSAPYDQSGGKNNIQAIASASTYLQRYTLLAICGLAVKGMDDDGAYFDTITPEQQAIIHSLMEERDTDVKKFCEYLRVDSIAQIPASRFTEATLAIKRKPVVKKKDASE